MSPYQVATNMDQNTPEILSVKTGGGCAGNAIATAKNSCRAASRII